MFCVLCERREARWNCPNCGRPICGRCTRNMVCLKCRRGQIKGAKKAAERRA